jgi:L-threonate 2-dehydrogenase
MQRDQRIGFIGLGAMGGGMAANLVRAGFVVAGCDRRQEPIDALVKAGGRAATSPAAAAKDARLLFVMVVNDAQVEDVLFGQDGALEALARGSTVVLSSTVPAAFVRDLAGRLTGHGIHLLDAPVSGGAAGAEGGTLTIMASGTAEAFAAAD